jgi:hypothetical protein
MLQAFISATIIDNTIFYAVFFESFQRRGEPEQLYPTGTPISNVLGAALFGCHLAMHRLLFFLPHLTGEPPTGGMLANQKKARLHSRALLQSSAARISAPTPY